VDFPIYLINCFIEFNETSHHALLWCWNRDFARLISCILLKCCLQQSILCFTVENTWKDQPVGGKVLLKVNTGLLHKRSEANSKRFHENCSLSVYKGAHCSIVGWGTMLQARRSRVRIPIRSLNFSIDLILPAALHCGPRIDSSFNRNEYQESSWG
jgi:hypothetical protein